MEKNNQKRCYICDRPMDEEMFGHEGFGSISKEIVIYDAEDLIGYEDKDGFLKFCHKCDHYFGHQEFCGDYRVEHERLSASAVSLKEKLIDYKAVLDMMSLIEMPSNKEFLKRIEDIVNEYIACMQWLNLPQRHVKIKRYFRA